jgi:uncharacterized repeat protein (TIGR01451 family)
VITKINHPEGTMKTLLLSIHSITVKTLCSCLALAVFMVCSQPRSAQAATSGNATIYNTVKVTYLSGSTSLYATANVSVTVSTVAAAPTITNPANQTTIAGALVTYTYTIKSNSNGVDTYTTSLLTNTPTNISAATGPTVTPSVQLWGGIALGSGTNTISVPFGTITGLTAGSSTVQIGTSTYTVTTITPGSAAYTDASGNLVAEVSTTLTLTLISGTAITPGSVTPGTQVGEFKKSLIETFTTGTPSTIGTDGTYATHFTVSTVLTPVVTFTTTDVITTASSPSVTITKTANPAGTVNPGGTITYTITVRNTHASASVSNVTVIDPVPTYTNYVSGTTRLNSITVTGDGAISPLIAGLAVDSNSSRTAGAAATGILPASGIAVVTFQVIVQ